MDREECKKILQKILTEAGGVSGVCTASWTIQAERAGMIAKGELEHGAYYYGDCRNGSVAMWDKTLGKFRYIRGGNFAGDEFEDTIEHPEDDDGYDVFVPVGKVEPLECEKVDV